MAGINWACLCEDGLKWTMTNTFPLREDVQSCLPKLRDLDLSKKEGTHLPFSLAVRATFRPRWTCHLQHIPYVSITFLPVAAYNIKNHSFIVRVDDHGHLLL